MVRTPRPSAGSTGSLSAHGTKIPQATQCSLEKIIENEIIIAIIIIENNITIIEGRPQSVFLLRFETELPVCSGRKEKHIKDKSVETEEVNTVIIHK